MDADDISAPDRLEKQAAVMRDDTRLDMVGTFFSIIDAEGKVIEKKETDRRPHLQTLENAVPQQLRPWVHVAAQGIISTPGKLR